MRQPVEPAGSISSELAVIREKADNITQVVTTITKVADQTNLLTINAAIEAEKAGEHGRGFRVVAREARRLADQTAVATLDIESRVQPAGCRHCLAGRERMPGPSFTTARSENDTMRTRTTTVAALRTYLVQGAVSAGVMQMDKFGDEVRSGVGRVAEVNGQAVQIIAGVAALSERFGSVNEGMNNQAAGARHTNEAMGSLAANVRQRAAAGRPAQVTPQSATPTLISSELPFSSGAYMA
jgi:methyl-accepting chemotaxis protein WspA